MNKKINYNGLEYQRPDKEKLSCVLEEIADNVRNAATYKELKDLFEKYDHTIALVRSQAVLAQLRYLCDITNEFYQNEYIEFVSNADSWIMPENVSSAFLESKFLKDLKDDYGPLVAKNFEMALSTNKGEDIIIEEQKLQNEYQMLVYSLEYTIDGKGLTSEELSAMKKSGEGIKRAKAKEAEYRAYLDKKEDFERIFKSLVSLRNKRARLNGFKNYIDMGNLLWGRYDYDEDEMMKASNNIVKYFRPIYDELIEIQKKDMNMDTVRICDKNQNFKDGLPLHGDLLKASHDMFHKMGKETGDYFDELVVREAIDLGYSPVKMPNIGFQNYVNEIGLAPIFASLNNKPGDVMTVVHEFGHSFQEYKSAQKHEIVFDIIPSADISEIASRTMEFFAYEHAEGFFGQDKSKWIYYHASGVVNSILTFCFENEFENYLYENEGKSLKEISKKYLEMRKKYLPFDYDEFEDLIHQGAEFFMFDSFITFPKYVFCYVPAYINAIELVFHKDGRYDKYLDMCNHLGHRTYEETLEAAGLHHAFDEEAICEAAETLRNIILREHNNMQVK